MTGHTRQIKTPFGSLACQRGFLLPFRSDQRIPNMNKNQRTLTYAALFAFVLISLFAPWDLTGNPAFTNVTRYAPLFLPPELGPWAKRELASGFLWSCFAIGVIYSGLFFALRQPRPTTEEKQNAS